MKTLSKEEMKNIIGGDEPQKTYKCCIGTECTTCAWWVNCSAQATEYEC